MVVVDSVGAKEAAIRNWTFGKVRWNHCRWEGTTRADSLRKARSTRYEPGREAATANDSLGRTHARSCEGLKCHRGRCEGGSSSQGRPREECLSKCEIKQGELNQGTNGVENIAFCTFS